jgi:hypothetical protein
MTTIQEIQKEIEAQAISWGEAIVIGDHRTANRKNSAITKIAKMFKKDRNLGELILVPLLKHINPSVRLMASVHALDLGIDAQEAQDVLAQVAGDPNIHVVQLMAKINLQKWMNK